ncbi:hypothetical protein E4T56_gene9837 [Termitomyces sp. T112]|nr:hypothetical protein E4T56_gene9837 [Termitomyces sp. T112]
MSLTKQTLVIAGLEVNVYSASSTTIAERKEVVVLFLLHGRYGRAEEVDPIARSLIEQTQTSTRARSLLIITFDQRNHGKRLVERKGNEAWSKDKTSSKHNERHAIDMYAIQTGTARDVSLLIDFLPSFLYPDNEAHPIAEWAVAGISLGGHATWITLATDDRVTTGVPIIGCPDFSKLIAYRAKQNDVELTGRYYPKSFKDLVAKMDPASLTQGPLNPFLGKKVLVLSGANDTLVPWEASEEFVTQKLNVGTTGLKKVIVSEGVGHECTERMVQEMATFVADNCLCYKPHKL